MFEDYGLQPVVKYEYFDPDTDVDDNGSSIVTAGVNYFFNDWTRLQLNYLYKAEEGTEIANDEILMQLQVKF
jgi:phosphate-selective porin